LIFSIAVILSGMGEELKRMLGGIFLGSLLAFAGSLGIGSIANHHLHDELFVMVRPGFTDQVVIGGGFVT